MRRILRFSFFCFSRCPVYLRRKGGPFTHSCYSCHCGQTLQRHLLTTTLPSGRVLGKEFGIRLTLGFDAHWIRLILGFEGRLGPPYSNPTDFLGQGRG